MEPRVLPGVVSRLLRASAAGVALAGLSGCATQLAWPPAVERLPEGAARSSATVKPVPVTLEEIVELSRSGTPSGVIIQKLRDSRLTYSITAEQAGSLASKGVASEVIAFLQHGEAGIAPRRVPAYVYPTPYPYPYGYPYGYPYWGYGYGPGAFYPRSSLFFGFGRRW